MAEQPAKPAVTAVLAANAAPAAAKAPAVPAAATAEWTPVEVRVTIIAANIAGKQKRVDFHAAGEASIAKMMSQDPMEQLQGQPDAAKVEFHA